MENINFELKGFNCAGCLPKIEKAITQLKGVTSCKINFTSSTMSVEGEGLSESEIKDIFLRFEPHVKIRNLSEEVLHDHHHGEEEVQNCERYLLVVGIILYFTTIFFIDERYSLISYLLSYIIIGNRVLRTAFKNIKRGMVLDENFLMTIATFGAFAIGEYSEAVAVMLFYLVGETLQDYAVDRSRRSIKEAMDIVPEKANLKVGDEIKEVAPKTLKVGDILIIRAGEKVPVDSKVLTGSSSLNTSALTGESNPVDVSTGDTLLSGAINLRGILEVKVEKTYVNSTVNKILQYVEKASERKAEIEKFMTKFSRYYTPGVVGISLLVFLVPGFYTGDFKIWLYRALLFLVISCPCALVVSIPLGVFSGIGRASSRGILVKGGNYLEILGRIGGVVFDKTGTLTKGEFEVIKDTVRKDITDVIIAIESGSTHPVAKSIVKHYGKTEYLIFDSFTEEHGYGIVADYAGKKYLVGNQKLMEKYNISIDEFSELGTAIYVAVEGDYAGGYLIGDRLRDESKELITFLKSRGIKSYMLSGDRKPNANAVAEELGIESDNVFAELLPDEKMDMYEKIKRESGSRIAFVGDGINDAPVLRLSDVGISLGGTGSDAALEAADVVIMDNNIGKIRTGIEISKNVENILLQNVVFSLGIKAIVMILGVLGHASMWLAVFADVGVALIAVLNAMRILKKNNR
ncbi:MAG: heavy metal translocating P-type ATPase [Fusobacteriaceae bacterium]